MPFKAIRLKLNLSPPNPPPRPLDEQFDWSGNTITLARGTALAAEVAQVPAIKEVANILAQLLEPLRVMSTHAYSLVGY